MSSECQEKQVVLNTKRIHEPVQVWKFGELGFSLWFNQYPAVYQGQVIPLTQSLSTIKKNVRYIKFMNVEHESRSVVSDSLQPHGLYSPWNSPGQKTGMGSLSLFQGIFPTQESNPGLLSHVAGRFFTS